MTRQCAALGSHHTHTEMGVGTQLGDVKKWQFWTGSSISSQKNETGTLIFWIGSSKSSQKNETGTLSWNYDQKTGGLVVEAFLQEQEEASMGGQVLCCDYSVKNVRGDTIYFEGPTEECFRFWEPRELFLRRAGCLQVFNSNNSVCPLQQEALYIPCSLF